MPAEEEVVVEEPAGAPEPVEAGVEEPADIVALISEGDEEAKPVLDKKDKALIRFKQRDKASSRENVELKERLAEVEKKLQDRELTKPDPEKYDGGAEDDRYAEDLEAFVVRKASVGVEEQIAKRLGEEREAQRTEEHIEKYESIIRDNQEKVNELINAQIKDKPEVLAMIQSDSFMQTLAQVPIVLSAKIAKSPDVGIIFEYYAKNPTRFANLAANNPEEVMNLGIKMGQIAQLKSKGKAPNVIKPLQGGDNTAKLHPVKDYDKYKLPDGTHDTARWRKDMFSAKQ